MNGEVLIRAGIVAGSLAYFMFFRTDFFLLDVLFGFLLISNVISIGIRVSIRTGQEVVDLHQQILQEERVWWESRKAARREGAK